MDVSRVVETVFTASAAGYAGGVSAAARASDIASGAVGRLTGMMAPLTAALSAAGIVGIAKEIGDLGGQFEQTKIQVAGFLQALGMTSDINLGLKLAEGTMNKIISDSAKLPGEAEDYLTVFKMGLATVGQASHKNVNDIVAFTNKYAAVASALSVDSEQAARDLVLLLGAQGRAGMHVKMFQNLVNSGLLKTKQGADMTAQAFNNLSRSERFKVIEQGLAKMDPMLKIASDSWDAMTGAAASNLRMVARISTTPVFELLKKGLGEFNAMFMDADGNLTAFSKNLELIGMVVGKYLGGGFDIVLEKIKQATDAASGFASKIMQSKGFALMGKALGGAGAAVGNLVEKATGGGVGGKVEEYASRMFDLAGTRLAMLVTLIEPFGNALLSVGKIIFDAFTTVMPAVQEAINMVLPPLIDLGSWFFNLISTIAAYLQPTLQEFWNSIARYAKALYGVIGGLLTFVMPAIKFVAGFLWNVIGFMLKQVVTVLTSIIDALSWVLEKLGKALPKTEAQQPSGPNFFDDIMKAFDEAGKEQAKRDEEMKRAQEAGNRGAPNARDTNQIYQDFRNSRFDITQKFEEGFDPDRIAVAFADDLGKLGEKRLQSGFEPLFGIR